MELLSCQVIALELENSKLKHEVALTKEESKQLKTELLEQKIHNTKLEYVIKDLGKQQKEAQNKLVLLECFQRECETKAVESSNREELLRLENNILNHTLEELTSTMQRLQAQQNQLESENAKLKAQLEGQQLTNSELIRNHGSITGTIAEHKSLLAKLKQEVEIFLEVKDDAGIDKLNAELAALKTVLEKTENERKLLSEEVCYYKAHSEALHNYLMEDSCVNHDLNCICNQWAADFQQMKQVVEKLAAENASLLRLTQAEDNL